MIEFMGCFTRNNVYLALLTTSKTQGEVGHGPSEEPIIIVFAKWA